MSEHRTSLRERLRDAQLPSTLHTIVVADSQTTAAAQRALSDAQIADRIAQAGDDEQAQQKAAEHLRGAEAAFEACVERVKVSALAAGDYEALVAAHPPAKGDGDDAWDPATFRPALLEACVEGDMTVEDWTVWLNSVSTGEADALWLTCLALNIRAPELSTIPKGWTATRS